MSQGWGPQHGQGYGYPPAPQQGYPQQQGHWHGPQQMQGPPGAPRCIHCGFQGLWTSTSKVSGGGWVLFVVLLICCFPLCWIPLIAMRETGRKCGQCGIIMGGYS